MDMTVNDIMQLLEEMKAAVISTVDQEGQPHARYINIGMANEQGVFFMTSPKTDFYQQLQANPSVALTVKREADYLIQVIRIEGQVKELNQEMLDQVLEGNPYANLIYPNKEDQAHVKVFQIYSGKGFYHSMTQGHKYLFEF